MGSLSFEICRPTEEHAKCIMGIRNEKETLRQSFHSSPKVWEFFWPEFLDTYFVDPLLPPLLLLSEGKRVGYVRFRRIGEPYQRPVCDVSIALRPEVRGKGLSVAALNLALDYLKNTEIEKVIAEIRKGNEVSEKAFSRAGFKFFEKTQKLIKDTGEKVEISRFAYHLMPEEFSSDGRVFVIAEAGSNWRMGNPERDLQMGRRLIEKAKEAGADAVKFQTYRPETVYVENAGGSDYLSKSGIKSDIRSIFSDLQMPDELVEQFAKISKQVGIKFMSTSFSPRDFRVVDPCVAVHKIASYEISHIHLIRMAAKTGKPTILSTGASNEPDISWAVNTFKENGDGPLCVMQCTAKYPAPHSALNLRVIPWLRRKYGVVPGFSDHSRDPIVAPMAAVALGAKVVEKHFTLSNYLPGPDHAFAILPNELKKMVKKIREVEETLGSGHKEVLKEERELAAYARRGLQATKEIKEGDVLIEDENFGILRPGKQPLGIHPKFLPEVNGKRASRRIPLGHGIEEGDWKN